MAKDQLIIFDTTLRDGEQSPGASMTRDEKVRIAKALERLRVDVIEAGFAVASPGISRLSKQSRLPLKSLRFVVCPGHLIATLRSPQKRSHQHHAPDSHIHRDQSDPHEA